MKSRSFMVLLAGALLAGMVGLGWQVFWFEADDAYIAYRYVHNLHVGRGPVWNPAPFLPVEGYSSFLWVMCLWGTWEATGFEPPTAANWLALGCGVVTLAWLAAFLRRITLPEPLARHRLVLTWLCLVTIAGNPTFLTWLSSGLETAMFQLWLVGWVLIAVRTSQGAPLPRLLALAGTATLAALTRPEGLLCVAATAAVFGTDLLVQRRPRRLLAAAPMVAVAAHVVWRRDYYGEWLPNTYFAKDTSWWPEAGLRYLASFVVEHGTWVWLLVGAVVAVRSLSSAARGRHSSPNTGALAAGAVVGGIVAYYTLRIGGDIFGYRPFSPLVPLAAVSLLPLLARLSVRPVLVGGTQLLLLLGSSVGWLQYAMARGDTGDHSRTDVAADALPQPLAFLLRPFDRWQQWLQGHSICYSSRFHRQFTAFALASHPTRNVDDDVWHDLPVAIGTAVGVLGWTLPNVAILDAFGLNDWVVARNPIYGHRLAAGFGIVDLDQSGHLDRAEFELGVKFVRSDLRDDPASATAMTDTVFALHDRNGNHRIDLDELADVENTLNVPRRLAHERFPPAGYFEAFRPNARVEQGRLVITPRDQPLTPSEVETIERQWRARRGQ